MKVALTWSANSEEINLIRNALPRQVEMYIPPERQYFSRLECDPKDLLQNATDAEVAMGWIAPAEFIERASNLRLLVWLHAGCDQLDFGLLRKQDIILVNVAGANGVNVAEHAIALLLGLAKRLLVNHTAVVEAQWTPFMQPGFANMELYGKTLAIIGLGNVGRQVAKRARAFDMRIVAVKRNCSVGADSADVVYPPEKLHEVLAQADAIVLAVPLTPETHHLIGETELRAMKRNALLVNVARGDVVAEIPLHVALTAGQIGGYASDVWWDYPKAMPPSYHFAVPSRQGVHRLRNVLASGDAAGNVLEVKDRMIRVGAEGLAAFLKGERPSHLVDLALGY